MREEVKVINANEHRPVQPQMINDRDFFLSYRASLALDFMKLLAVSHVPGEHHDNYQSVIALTPCQIVEKACDVADAALKEFDRRGWVLSVPMWDQMVEQLGASQQRGPGFDVNHLHMPKP